MKNKNFLKRFLSEMGNVLFIIIWSGFWLLMAAECLDFGSQDYHNTPFIVMDTFTFTVIALSFIVIIWKFWKVYPWRFLPWLWALPFLFAALYYAAIREPNAVVTILCFALIGWCIYKVTEKYANYKHWRSFYGVIHLSGMVIFGDWGAMLWAFGDGNLSSYFIGLLLVLLPAYTLKKWVNI